MKSAAILILAVISFFGSGTMISSAANAQKLVITSPLNGAVLPTQQQAIIEAEFVPPVDFLRAGIQARVEAAHGGSHFLIGEGDLRSISSPDRLSAPWNVFDFPPGDYVITVTATAGGRTGTASVRVTVHPRPVVSLRVASLLKTAGSTRVTYLATAHSPVGTAIREFIWTPGDGSPPVRTATGSFSHVYSGSGTSFIVWLEVNDSLGGSTLIARDLNLPRSPTQNGGVTPLWADHLLKETHDCGCEEMTVLVPDPEMKPPPQTGVYCLGKKQKLLNAPGCKFVKNPAPPGECPPETNAYQCDLGQFSPRPGSSALGWTFEAVAKLSERTNDESKCEQGQYARTSGTIDGQKNRNPKTDMEPPSGKVTLPDGTVEPKGFTFTAVKPNQPLPPFKGPDYGADDYAHPRFDKRHLPGEFRWRDQPLNPGLVRAKSLTQEAEFIDFVRGNLGTCWCRFSIKEEWAKDGGVKVSELKLIDQFHCSVKKP